LKKDVSSFFFYKKYSKNGNIVKYNHIFILILNMSFIPGNAEFSTSLLSEHPFTST